MALVEQVVGGAGTGKTTELMKILDGLLTEFDIEQIGVASFSRQGRATAVERACAAFGYDPSLLARQGWFRTIHSACYRIGEVRRGRLIAPGTVEGQKWLVDRMAVELRSQMDDEAGVTTYVGDSLEAKAMNIWDYCRNAMRPLRAVCDELATVSPGTALWYEDALRIIQRYETAKRIDDRCDFADILLDVAGVAAHPEHGFADKTPVGEIPAVAAWLIDEAQDLSPLTARVVERLANSCDYVWLVGDPFQSIYGFAGATPAPFMQWPGAIRRVMPRSYRCPAVISDLGEWILSGCSDYWDRKIQPASHEGVIESAPIESVCSLVKPSEDWMILSRTNFLAARVRKMLDDADIPARSTRSEEATQANLGKGALWRLEHGQRVDPIDFGYAMKLLPARGLLDRGAKSKYVASEHESVHITDLKRHGFNDEAQAAVFTGEWVTFVDGGERFHDIADRHGIETAVLPKVRCGTIHSVKGAEADNVIVVDASCAAAANGAAVSTPRMDEELRLAYVAVTRARRRLIVASDAQSKHRIPGLTP
jgi:DNA helicase II / ATP-dependent DNA helicase PcrA